MKKVLVYYAAYGTIIFSAFAAKKNNYDKEKTKKIIVTVAFLTLTLLLGLRHPSMGIDLGYNRYYGYLVSFKEIAEMPFVDVIRLGGYQNYEKGYIILNKLIGYISKDPQVFLFIYSLITFLPVSYIIYKKSNNPLFSFIIYMGLPVFTAHFSTLRQILAVTVCLMSIEFIENREFAKFLFLVLLATTFHSSAILFTVAYVAYRVRLPIQWRLASVFALPLVFVFRTPLFNILSKLLKENAVPQDNGSINFFLVLVAIYMFCILFFNTADRKINGYMNVFYIACFCQLFGNIYMTATRVAWFFMTVLILLLPYGLSTIKSKKLAEMFSVMIMCAFIAFGIYTLRTTSWAQSYPYRFYWDYVFTP